MKHPATLLLFILSLHTCLAGEGQPPSPDLKAKSLYVVGDSISTPGAWPSPLAQITGRHTFSQAIGGTTSPSMVARARGAELIAPLKPPTEPGTIHMRWSRPVADRTQDNKYRAQWAYYAKAVSEPASIEVSQNGRVLGQAKKSLKAFTTDYARNPKAIMCPGHGLKDGDRVVFISNDPGYPLDLSVLDAAARWNFSGPNLPKAIVERRVYFVAGATPDSFELKELQGDAGTMDIGGDAAGSPEIECGWDFDVGYAGGPWDVTWRARTKYDGSIWLLEVSANDIPGSSVTAVTIPNTALLLAQMTSPHYILVCPPSGSFKERGPGTFNWTNYYDTYMPWVRKNHPANHVDTMAVLDAGRTATELGLLRDPKVPEHLWIAGKPGDESTWQAFREPAEGAHETWVGPGYVPLQFRTSFEDNIHLGSAGNKLLAATVAALIAEKGW
ncbi:MAG: hypothetical protein WCS31_02285 [Verrucomicrobiae bacterium]